MDLVRWEGTLWARQRFERDECIKVKDTTGDGISEWVDMRRVKKGLGHSNRIKVKTEIEVTEGMDPMADGLASDPIQPEDDLSEVDDEDDDDDNMDEDVDVAFHAEDNPPSVGHDLNRRLLQAIAARNQGMNIELDPEFEDYMKRLIESGGLHNTARPADGPLLGEATTPDAALRQPAA